ncbi:MAG: hypothetical protein ACYC69_11645 [Thermodesulfovibrionales bacterium]
MKKLKYYCRSMAVICLLLITAATGTAFGETSYSSTGVIYLSQVDVSGVGLYEAFLKAADKNGEEFYLQSAAPFVSGQPADATFDQATGILHISDLSIIIGGSLRNRVSVDMLLQPGSDPMRFRVTSVIAANLPYAASSTITGIIGPLGNIVRGSGFTVADVEPMYFYVVDFGADVSGLVCSCTMSFEEMVETGPLPPIQSNLARPSLGLMGCIIMKGGLVAKEAVEKISRGSNSITFFFPDGTPGFHFICKKS